MNKKIKIVIAIDSFKDSISSNDAAQSLERGIRKVNPDIEISKIPIADGGEGTVDSVINSVGGEYVDVKVNDPLFREINAKYGIFNDGSTAIIEMAAASGLGLLNDQEKNPMLTSTFGTGEMILDAVERGINKIIIGIGGSATNDGGIGLASALGINFLDSNGQQLSPVGGSLCKICSLDLSNKNAKIGKVDLTVICDVINPLYGKNGAAYVYGPQKGADEKGVKYLDSGLVNLSKIVERELGVSLHNTEGAGAAGGLGYGLMVFAGAKLVNGIDFLIEFLNLENIIKTADYVITGEGKLDQQTRFNKTPWGIMLTAKKFNKKTIAVAGTIAEGNRKFFSEHFDKLFSLSEFCESETESINNPQKYLQITGEHIANYVMAE